MKVLVTGGAGFIGSHFIRYWLTKYPDDFVVNFDKLGYASDLSKLDDVATNSRYSFVQGDLEDFTLLEQVVTGVDLIVHFAAETHVDRSIESPDPFIYSNIVGTYNLLEASRMQGVKHFHHVSTDEVLGDLGLDAAPWDESAPYNPSSPYSASKAASDHLVRAWSRTYGLPVTITNCTNNIGTGMFPEKFVPLAITNLLTGKKVPIYGDGGQSREWLDVRDHCSAIDLVIEKGRLGETYFVGPEGARITNLETAQMIIELLDKDESDLEYVEDRPGHDVRYAVDSAKIRTELGWRPHYSLIDTLMEMIAWHKASLGNQVINKKTVLVLGKGQFAGFFKDHLSKNNYKVVIAENCDIRNYGVVKDRIQSHNADIVINTAAKTDLDWCEKNQLECFEINTLGAENVAKVCQDLDKYLVHISTGCIQGSSSPAQAHKEDAPPSPTSFYSWCKYWADLMLLDRVRQGAEILILRPRQPLSAQASSRNALTKLLTYTKFIDTPNSATILEDFVDVALTLIQRRETGVYNVTNPGVTSPYRIAQLLKEYVEPSLEINLISKDELNSMTFATRIDSVLDTSKLEATGIKLVDIETRLRQILPTFAENLKSAPEILEKTMIETETKLSIKN